MPDKSAGFITLSWEPAPPLVPKKYLAGRRYRLRAKFIGLIQIDTHGIVDSPVLRDEWPPPRWFGYVMGLVKEDAAPIYWDAKAMAARPKRFVLKPEEA